MKKAVKILGAILLGGLIVGGIVGLKKLKKKDGQKLKIGKAIVLVEIKDTEEERRQGLSNRENLDKDAGVLFIFEESRKYEFWMKEMKFDLDFVWINGEEVVEITEGVKAPEEGGGPARIKPKVLVDKVLEVNSGWVKDNQVKVGEIVRF